MSPYDAVPELSGQVLLSDTGVETDLIFHHGFDLPLFAAFVLADDPAGRDALERWHRDHAMAATDSWTRGQPRRRDVARVEPSG